jgi:DNA-binding MurR/RpiR family transcriptional regulator
MTQEEKTKINESIWLSLIDIHNKFVDNIREDMHPKQIEDWVHHLHHLQRIICVEELRNRIPEWFDTKL